MAAYYTFEDLSGTAVASTKSDNPYDGLIETCKNDSSMIQSVYHKHRANRNAQQKAKLLAPDFTGVTVDEILAKLEDPSIEPGFEDWRHCLVFWARPPLVIRDLIGQVQQKLLQAAPNLWTMPRDNLHMTALEVTHSRTAHEIDDLVKQLLPTGSDIAEYTYSHRVRLVKPLVSFDAQALALSFLPASGEPGFLADDDGYSYHHLRRDLFAEVQAAGVKVDSRYVVPSAHLTIGRFITKRDFETNGVHDPEKMARFLGVIENVNLWLESEFWPKADYIPAEGVWPVGKEVGLDCRQGKLWYGGGETMFLGQGF